MTGSGRLLSLLSLLQARRDWPGLQLAERLGISARTVRRDVDRLRELGYPIAAIKGPDGGYRLAAGSELPPLLFDDEQAVALSIALRLAITTGAGIGEAAARALVTLRQVMPARLRHRIDALQVTALPRPDPQADPEVLLAISTAIGAHEVLRFDYAQPGKSPDPRRAEPLHLLTRGGRWYLLAWDLDREDWRTFRADRITPRVPTGPRFTPREVPGGAAATFVAARFRGSTPSATGTAPWPCEGEVVLRCAASDIAPYAVEGAVEGLGPQRCRLRMGAWSWAGLAARIGGAEADIEAVDPPELRTAFAALAHRFAAAATAPSTSPERS